MKLVPFFLTTKQTGQFTFTCLHLFLSHAGKTIWKTDEAGIVSLKTILEDYCEPNGFVVKQTQIEKDIVYIQIDPEQTRLSDFYTWDEALANPQKPECWRRFVFVKDKEQADWWSPKDIIEAELQDYGNVNDLYSKLSSLFSDT